MKLGIMEVPDLCKQFVHYLYRHIRWVFGHEGKGRRGEGKMSLETCAVWVACVHERLRNCCRASMLMSMHEPARGWP